MEIVIINVQVAKSAVISYSNRKLLQALIQKTSTNYPYIEEVVIHT